MLKEGRLVSLLWPQANANVTRFYLVEMKKNTRSELSPASCLMPRLRKQATRLYAQQIGFGILFIVGGTLLNTAGCHAPSSETIVPPKIINRSAWHARQPNFDAQVEHGSFDAKINPAGWLVYRRPLSEVLKTIVIHHSALPLSEGPSQIQKVHMIERGFADIGYHFLVDENGFIFEGRSIAVRGCHTAGHNSGTIGVVLLGNFEIAPPPQKQIAGMTALIQYLVIKYGLTHLAGHQDFQPGKTACPGRLLEALLPDLATVMGLQFGVAGYKLPAEQISR